MAASKARRAARRGWTWHWPAVRAGGLLMVMALVAYALLARADFIWDDDAYIINNDTLRSLDGLRRIWFEIGAVQQYYPLVHTMFWFEYHLWSLAPLGYHLVNVLLHGASAILLWRLILRLNVPGAWLAAAIFAVHPVEVESVAWATERKNVFSLALALASILCYLRFAPAEETKATTTPSPTRWRWYALAMALFAGALLSKTVMASLPAVLLVIYWWKTGRIRWANIAPLLPFFALGIGLGLVTVWMEKHHVGAEGEQWAFTRIERVLIAGRALWFYAGKLAWPYPLVFFYPRWTIDAHEAWQYLFPAAVLGVIAALWMARARIGRGPLAAVLIFSGVLVPAIGFFDVYPFRYSFVADHFQYHASIALIALAAAAGTVAATHARLQQRAIAKVAAAILLATLTALTMRQTLIYRNLETLYRHTIANNPTGWIAYTNLAQHLQTIGRLDDAVEVVREALSLDPNEPTIYNNLGVFLSQQGKRDGFRRGQLEEVIAHYNTALQFDPNYVEAHINLAHALSAAHEPDQAIKHLNRALELNPSHAHAAQAHLDLGNLFVERNDLPSAAWQYDAAVRLQPQYAEAVYNLGATHLMMGNLDKAIKYFNEAIRLQPDHARAKVNLQRALDAKWKGRAK